MTFNPDDPTTWPIKISIIAHDVGRSNDRSTAVVGCKRPPLFGPQLLGVRECRELPLRSDDGTVGPPRDQFATLEQHVICVAPEPFRSAQIAGRPYDKAVQISEGI